EYQRAIESGEKIIVGQNKFVVEETPLMNLLSVDDSIRQLQIDKIKKVKAERNNDLVAKVLNDLQQAAKDGSNLMPHILNAVEGYVTLGEIADQLRGVFGEY
ncbi:MAG: methylmalonyl-CoA mutase family protein, partial [Bacteroidota bacterium]